MKGEQKVFHLSQFGHNHLIYKLKNKEHWYNIVVQKNFFLGQNLDRLRIFVLLQRRYG